MPLKKTRSTPCYLYVLSQFSTMEQNSRQNSKQTAHQKFYFHWRLRFSWKIVIILHLGVFPVCLPIWLFLYYTWTKFPIFKNASLIALTSQAVKNQPNLTRRQAVAAVVEAEGGGRKRRRRWTRTEMVKQMELVKGKRGRSLKLEVNSGRALRWNCDLMNMEQYP